MSGRNGDKGKQKRQNQEFDESYEVDDEEEIASNPGDQDRFEHDDGSASNEGSLEDDDITEEDTAGFRVQLDPKLDPENRSQISGIRIKAEDGDATGKKVCFDLGEDEDQRLSKKEQEKLRQLHKETTDLRLQKIYQHDKYHTPSSPANLNQDFFETLHERLETENNKFTHLSREELEKRKHETDPTGNKIYKYTEKQTEEFDTASTSLHQALAISKIGENNFTITHTAKSQYFSSHPYASQVNVSFKEESSAKKIAIKGKQDNISVMLLAAMTAKEKLGNNAKYYIYSSKNTEGLAELFARAEIYGLDPKPLKRPEQSEEEFKKFAELVTSEEFKQKIEHYKSIHQLSDQHLPNDAYKSLKAQKLTEAKKPDDPSDPETSSSESYQPPNRDIATSSTHQHPPGPTLRRKRSP